MTDDEIKKIGSHVIDAFKAGSSELIFNLADKVSISHSKAEKFDFKIEGSTLSFNSIAARNRVLAEYIYLENKNIFKDDHSKWLIFASELWRNEVRDEDTATGRLLAKVHESNDLFLIGKTAIETRSLRVFDVLHLIEATLPYIANLSADSLIELVSAQHEGTKNDLAGGMFFNKLETKLASLPKTCRNIRVGFIANSTESIVNLYSVALVALAESSHKEALAQALLDAKSNNKIVKKAAIWTMSRFLQLSNFDESEVSTMYKEILENISSKDEEIRKAALYTASSMLHTTNVYDECITKLAEASDQYVLGLVANSLYMHTAEIKQKNKFSDWVCLLANISSENTEIVNKLDFVLSQLVDDESQQQIVIYCWTQWCNKQAKELARDKSIAKLFDSLIYKLANKPELLSQVITSWFLADDSKLASFAAGVLSHLSLNGYHDPEFNTIKLDELSHNDLMFLVKRMLGFIFAEQHLLSLTLSLLKSVDARNRTFPIVHSLITEEIGRDYPRQTIEALEKVKSETSDTEQQDFFSALLIIINTRLDELNALPRLNELRSSTHLKREFEKARHKQMQASMEGAQKSSIFTQLCTKIPIKAGVGFLSFHDNKLSEPTKMHSISHSVAIPLRHINDAVGQEIQGLLLRLTKRED